MAWGTGKNNGSRADVTAILDSKAWEQLQLFILEGALVSMGLTSDGGALGITITVDGDWDREYFRDGEQLTLWVEESAAAVLEACAAKTRAASSARRTRRR